MSNYYVENLSIETKICCQGSVKFIYVFLVGLILGGFEGWVFSLLRQMQTDLYFLFEEDR